MSENVKTTTTYVSSVLNKQWMKRYTAVIENVDIETEEGFASLSFVNHKVSEMRITTHRAGHKPVLMGDYMVITVWVGGFEAAVLHDTRFSGGNEIKTMFIACDRGEIEIGDKLAEAIDNAVAVNKFLLDDFIESQQE